MKQADRRPDFRVWVREFGCLTPRRACSRKIDLHHVRTLGAGGKDESNVVPLCHVHHMEGHTGGWETFERKYDLDLTHIAGRLWATYSDRQRGPRATLTVD